MDYMDPDVHCPKKAVKLNHSLTYLAVMDYPSSRISWEFS